MKQSKNNQYIEWLYNQSLQSSIHHPLLIDMNNLENSLRGTETLNHIIIRKKLYNYFAEQLFNNDNDKKLFLWAISIILSRAISDTEITSYPFTIVPILDLCNHNNNENAIHHFDIKNQTFSLIALKDIDINTNIYISYGKLRDSHSFMSIYGFYNNNDDDIEKFRLLLKNINGKEIKILIPKSIILIINSKEWNDIVMKLKEETNDEKLIKTVISIFQTHEFFVDLINKSKELLNKHDSSDYEVVFFILSCIDSSLQNLIKPNESIEKLQVDLQNFLNDNIDSKDATINWKIQCTKVILNEMECLLNLKKIVMTYYLALTLYRKN